MPIRSGVVGTHLMVEEVGRKYYHGRVCMECEAFEFCYALFVLENLLMVYYKADIKN